MLAATTSQRDAPREWRYVRPWLYPLQERAIFDEARFVSIEAGTKTGKTVGCMAWLLERAWCGPRDGNHWWIAPYYSQARIAYDRFKKQLPPQVHRYHDGLWYIRLNANGATIWFKSAEKPDALYGEDVYSCVIDEATRCRPEAWPAVRSTLTATHGPCRIIGNVKGRKNWAFRMARRAQAGEKDHAYYRITADDAVRAGVLTAGEIEQAQIDIADDAAFRELYYAEATDEGASPFGLANIEACVVSDQKLLRGTPSVWGWDLARKQDWTVGVGLDQDCRVVGSYREQKPWTEIEEDIVSNTGSAFGLLDQTGLGDPVLAAVQQLARGTAGWFEGYVFTQSSKQDLMVNLARAIKKHRPLVPEGPIAEELRNFEYEHTRTGVRYSAPAGLNDDCVCALALAVWALDHCDWQGAELM